MIKEIDLQRPQDRHHLHGALHDGVFLVRSTVTESLLQEAYGFLSAFFGLTPEQKRTCRVPGGTGRAGYTPPAGPGQRGPAAGGRELFGWGATLPAGHPLRVRYPARYPAPYFPDHLVPGIGAALRELHTRMLRLQHEVLHTLAGALGAHPDYFTDMLQDGPATSRAAWYPPARQTPRTAPQAAAAQQAGAVQQAGAAPHQDPGMDPGQGHGLGMGQGMGQGMGMGMGMGMDPGLGQGMDPGLGMGLITTVPRAAAAGTDVRVEGRWLPAEAPPGYALVTVGLVLDRLTGGLARAAAHRAAPPPGPDTGRLSLAQCCHPAPWTTLTPLRPPGAAHGPQRFATLTADELFQRTLYRTGRPGAPGTAAPAR
ncbi:hypothetical protein [Streptomyces sp. NBC_01314]|uniref:hypothetical protein n=1 Tax=Streptomyces sp. NBC_01314 TaxID=2903821 RepID=UPI0030864EED|nr:hypothetical protein OG622_00490 [Streptomyces sp. NBC_01314]WRZ54326.1 hypothetical protein OG622_49710 [Streptomyces sp. NBC_01314]